MSINNFSQKNFLLNKLGLGRPQVIAEAAANQKPAKPAMAPKPAPATNPPAPKPGCGACRRKKK